MGRAEWQGVSMFKVHYAVNSPDVLKPILGDSRVEMLAGIGMAMASKLDGRRVVSINSTAAGGGVAEMLPVLLSYARGTGVEGRWFVLEGDPEFFTITKRLHHCIHGEPGDGGPLGEEERQAMLRTWERNKADAEAMIKPDDIMLVHDPQPTPMVKWLSELGTPVVWRCHIGVDVHNEHTEKAWAFLRPFLEPYVDQYVFTRPQYAPEWVPNEKLNIIRPVLDPFSAKSREIDPVDCIDILQTVGILDGSAGSTPVFTRTNGEMADVHTPAILLREKAPAPETPLVVQVSRWDPLKDMSGVMHAFVGNAGTMDAHLVLAGPDVASVSDDPEGQQVLAEVSAEWQALPLEDRERVSIVCLSMHDPEENAIVVNALQRHAKIVVQKSIKEGFGLTVTEAMYKHKPMVASAVGGIVDQVRDGVNGYLVQPLDIEGTGAAIAALLADPVKAAEMGEQGHAAAVSEFMPDNSLISWARTVDAALESRG